jgi:ssDNA-binding Zn-finger/Zn-ribbon topoisomerase 1
MPNLNPQYKFLLSAFTEHPDYLLNYIVDSENWVNLFLGDTQTKFNDIIQKIIRNDVELHALANLNCQGVTAWENFANKQWKAISSDNISPFESLKRFVDDKMILRNGEFYFKVNETELWHNITLKMGEDLFSAVLLADTYIKYGLEPKHFQWNYILHSNFFALNSLLKREKINENHFHLFGSSPHVDLSWLYLMNNPENSKKKLSGFEKGFALKQWNINTNAAFKQTELYRLVKIAAYIRLRLFEKCCLAKEWHIIDILGDIKRIREDGFLISNNYNKQQMIDVYKYQSHYYVDDYYAVDYAIWNFDKKENENIEISGERHLYYRCLKQIFNYKEKESVELQLLFYLYLLIKNKFDCLFIQGNNKYGFDNFEKYQSGKFDVIEDTIYAKLAVKLAVKYNMQENHIDKLELRITPKKSKTLLKKFIKNCDKFSEVGNNKNHFYVIHFIKNKNFDWGIKDKEARLPICRESKLREKIGREAKIINLLRKNGGDASFRIFGIDAASHEVDCRPEVFGQVFRYLSNSYLNYPFLGYPPDKIYRPQLRKTYHAGEDFYDIIDGLRAIDEAMLFLQLKHGDRIGHGVALGLDPEKYYKDRPIAMPLQNILDNCAWILYCIEKFGINISTSFYAQLISKFNESFNKLYNNYATAEKMISSDLNTYIEAWKLRGDNPACYFDEIKRETDVKEITKQHLHPITEWGKYNFCYREKYCNINANIYSLYHKYHFDFNLKKAAKEPEELKIDKKYIKEYIELVKQIQIIMKNLVLRKGVAVESNPSSNFLISKLDNIAELPIFNIFPIDESENDFLRLNVSVNTDDQGVFFTSLVKEYTLLAGTLQNEINSNGHRKYSDDKILNWIKHLIDNSKEQCFMQNSAEDEVAEEDKYAFLYDKNSRDAKNRIRE